MFRKHLDPAEERSPAVQCTVTPPKLYDITGRLGDGGAGGRPTPGAGRSQVPAVVVGGHRSSHHPPPLTLEVGSQHRHKASEALGTEVMPL